MFSFYIKIKLGLISHLSFTQIKNPAGTNYDHTTLLKKLT